ncbi:hypothetical protein L7F22_021122 [Adiantum nelumboides]|nr:hypothetical protein [Adiantum nelumboides]
MDGNKEESSSSEDRQPIPTAHEIGESSSQAEEALQVVTVVTMFKQLMENPRFMEFLKSSSIAHQVQGEKGYESFFGYGNGMDGNKEESSSSEDRQLILTAHEIGESSGQAEETLQVVTAVTMFKQLMENPRFMEFLKSSSIAHQVQGSFDMPRGTFGMAGYQNQQAGTTPICPIVNGSKVFMPRVSVPMLQAPPMDQLMAYDKPKPYKEDDQSVQFDTFSGFDERNKVFSFLEQFDEQKASGLLQPLPIPDKPWESITMDFIFDLPRTQMMSIVSDRDPCMTSLFWRGLFENMGTTLKFSSSFHPQTDGQSEEANSIVLDLLKCYVSEHKGKWEQYLPLVEYAYNNTVHSSTGKASFEIVEGGKKVPPILRTKDKIFEADKYVQDMDEMDKKVNVALEKTQANKKESS